MPLVPLPPTDTRPYFRPVARALVALLRELPPEAWDKATVAGAWRVRDVVAHILDGSLRRVSFHRDHLTPPAPEPEREFVAFINGLNRQWVDVARRMSPRVLTDVYELAGTALADFVESLPGDAPALFPVSWAGEDAGETARVVMTDDTAWRLLFNALPPVDADALVARSGDPALSMPLLRARSVIV